MSQAYIGLDVHKTTISIAIAFFGNDEPVSYGKCSPDINRFLKTLRRLMLKHSFEKKRHHALLRGRAFWLFFGPAPY